MLQGIYSNSVWVRFCGVDYILKSIIYVPIVSCFNRLMFIAIFYIPMRAGFYLLDNYITIYCYNMILHSINEHFEIFSSLIWL